MAAAASASDSDTVDRPGHQRMGVMHLVASARHLAGAAVFAALAGPLLSAPAVLPAYAADPTPTPAKKQFTIGDSRITESSGLARSIKHDGIWWTVNDSGDTARVYGVNEDGDVEAVLTFGAEVTDVEAVGVGTDGNIYVADIGDNQRERKTVTVYSVPEPAELESQRVKYKAYDFEYPDGAHDAEALLVHPENHKLYLVTKDEEGGLYTTVEDASRTGVNKLKKVGVMPALVTDATFVPDARRIMVRGYFTLMAMSWPAPKTYASVRLPNQKQGESIAMGPDDKTLLIGSEGENSTVYRIQLPPAKTAAKPPPVAPKRNAEQDAGKADHTRRWILIGTGLFALLTALITFPANRRERLDAQLERERAAHRQRRSQRDSRPYRDAPRHPHQDPYQGQYQDDAYEDYYREPPPQPYQQPPQPYREPPPQPYREPPRRARPGGAIPVDRPRNRPSGSGAPRHQGRSRGTSRP